MTETAGRPSRATPPTSSRPQARRGTCGSESLATSRAANLASFPAAKLTRSAHPDFKANPDVFNLAKTKAPGGNPNINGWYFHFTKGRFDKLGAKWFTQEGAGPGIPDEGTWDRGARHQFSVFGGEDQAVGETFFCRFLKDSGF